MKNINIDLVKPSDKELEITTVADKGITAETFEKQWRIGSYSFGEW